MTWTGARTTAYRAKMSAVMTQPVEERLWRNVDKSGDCWLWLLSVNTQGYAHISRFGRMVMVHRLIYELLVGPIPPGMTLDHLCRVRSCVNPAHLEPVTRGENILRGVGPSALNARKTHCPRGHAYDLFRRGARWCRRCQKESRK